MNDRNPLIIIHIKGSSFPWKPVLSAGRVMIPAPVSGFPALLQKCLHVRAPEEGLLPEARLSWYFPWKQQEGYANSLQAQLVGKALADGLVPNFKKNYIPDAYNTEVGEKFVIKATTFIF